ncbi:SgcJ/EcaC family oxidoreductase [Nocardia sp. NPDC051756]|uniref:SgcJ/EcaC family oxidoreductase n=1 Tax=Nocardia sp. NPDC051756 TaxID=3154751 RepID=UPI0034411694
MSTASVDTDLDAIREVVATIQHSQQNELVDEFIGLFREDAIWTTGGGKPLLGRAAIAEFTAKVLPGAMRDGTVTYEVVHVLFIRPDVAAVKVRQRYLTNDGELTGEGSPMYVMSKENGRWLLTANQNTVVAAD